MDLGTSSAKALLADRNGAVIASARKSYPTYQPGEGLSEQRAEDWLTACSDAVKACLETAGGVGVGVGVEAIALSGHMAAPVLLSEDGEVLAPVHTITDRRAWHEAESIPADVVAAIAARTGNLPATHFVLPKLLWWSKHEPDLWSKTAAVLAPKDFVRLRLTGETATEPTDAGSMLLFDPQTWRWDEDLAESTGVGQGRLPQLLPSRAIAGGLSRDAARILGLTAGLPVVAGAADMATALLGTGVDPMTEVAVTIGTSATVIAGIKAVDAALVGQLTFHPDLAEKSIFVLGSHFGGGGALAWLADLVGSGQASGHEPLAALAEAAATVPAGADGLLFLPYLSGADSPHFDPAARGAFLGLSTRHGREHLLRAIVEGVSADLCASIALMSPTPRKRIRFAGGGARIPFFAETLADLAGLPVAVSAESDSSAVGAALLAGLAVGWFDGDLATARAAADRSLGEIRPRETAWPRAFLERFRNAIAARRL